jgi:nucleotide-binding universal stress UspA family protein
MRQFKILVPLDGSEFAERALTILPALSGLWDPYIRLIGAVDTDELEFLPHAQEWIAKEERLLRSHLEIKQQELESDALLVGWEVQEGKPAQVILTTARRFHPDLLIISTHGRSGIERWRIGSVADKVIRATECNTLIVGPSTVPTRTSIREVLLPLDRSKLAEAGLLVALELVKSLDARLHIVRVATRPSQTTPVGPGRRYWKAPVLTSMRRRSSSTSRRS